MTTPTPPPMMPCPFCGHDKPRIDGPDDDRPDAPSIIVCPECGCSSDYEDTVSEARDAWNKRTPASPPPDLSRELTAENIQRWELEWTGRAYSEYQEMVADENGCWVEYVDHARILSAMHATLTAALSHAEAAGSAPMAWVKCSERMPEAKRYVLAWCPERRMAFQCTNEDGAWWVIGGGRIWAEFTHWMPLPKGPAETAGGDGR